MSSSREGLFFLLLSPLPSWWIAIRFLLMAAPYSHSLPQLTQEPVSSTSVNSADYSKMMRKARRLFTASTDSRHFCCHLHPSRLTGIWQESIFRNWLLSSPSRLRFLMLLRGSGCRPSSCRSLGAQSRCLGAPHAWARSRWAPSSRGAHGARSRGKRTYDRLLQRRGNFAPP